MFSNLTLSSILVIVVVLLFSTALHEIMHGYVALKLGDDLAYSQGRLTLNPIKHIDPILTIAMPLFFMLAGMSPIFAAKPVPINPNRVSGHEDGMALIAIAGPLTNFFLAALAAVILRNVDLSGFLLEFMVRFLQINVGLFIFNLLPIPPIDGSRVLYAFAPPSVQRVMERIEGFGIFAVIIIISVLLPVIGPVLTNANQTVIRFLLGY
jgi:Zn-dependent protease